jgi:hypothetical protein
MHDVLDAHHFIVTMSVKVKSFIQIRIKVKTGQGSP